MRKTCSSRKTNQGIDAYLRRLISAFIIDTAFKIDDRKKAILIEPKLQGFQLVFVAEQPGLRVEFHLIFDKSIYRRQVFFWFGSY